MVLVDKIQNQSQFEFSEVNLSNYEHSSDENEPEVDESLCYSEKIIQFHPRNGVQELPPFNAEPPNAIVNSKRELKSLQRSLTARKFCLNLVANSGDVSTRSYAKRSKENTVYFEEKYDRELVVDQKDHRTLPLLCEMGTSAHQKVHNELPLLCEFRTKDSLEQGTRKTRNRSLSCVGHTTKRFEETSERKTNSLDSANMEGFDSNCAFSTTLAFHSDTDSKSDISSVSPPCYDTLPNNHFGSSILEGKLRPNEGVDCVLCELSPSSLQKQVVRREEARRAALERLLHELYRSNRSRRQSSVYGSDTPSENLLICRKGALSPSKYKATVKYRKHLLVMKDVTELRLMHSSLSSLLVAFSSLLVKELKKKDKHLHRNHKQKDVVTAILHALSPKTRQDTRMRFSVEPFAGDSGFTQWHDAMKMCARLPGGIPQEFRRRMWLTLAEQHVRRRNMQWKDVERICFNEWASPDDEGLGDQIVKDLHRTGCSLFCGEEGEVNQVLLKRVLLGYARWNKSVGYCQGFNMLAAIILEVMDRQESDSLKVMIYLIEGVLPESYFANNLRGLSVDMAVFRELLRLHLPILSRHLETLQQEAADQATGACYEPPLTNVFTMQWFLTLFSNCLPKDVVMRVWDLTFLHGNEMLLRTALAIWGKFANRIMEVPTADEFYCVMGNLTREMLTYGLMDANLLVKTLIGMAPFPFPGLATLRDKYNYNITPWTVSSVARKGLKIFYLDDDDDEEEKGDHEDVNHTMAVATAFGLAGILRKTSGHLVPSSGQNMQDGRNSPSHGPHSMRPNLDISQLKKQYERLRERQRQTHVILTASNIRRKSMDEINRLPSLQKTNQITMKHLLRGKKALTTRTKRVVPQGVIPNIMTKKKTEGKIADGTVTKNRHSKQSKSSSSANNKSNVGKQKIATNLDGPILQSPITVSHQQLMPKRSLPEEDQISNIEDIASPAVTIHWKDTPRRVKRRASLPYGVKLMEGPAPPTLPDIKDDTDDDGGSSTSTELCDENLLADLSEEEIVADSAIVRPLSTSPRLENHQDSGNPKERLTELLKEKPRTIIIPDKDAKGKNSDKLINVVKVKPEIILESYAGDLMQPPIINLDEINTGMERIKPPNELNIPHILESLTQPELIGNHNKRSLSSPTKWKWSFSEIENPELVEPVSPILKLHNFSSEEILEEKNISLPNMTLQPEINIEKETTKVNSPEDDKKQDDQQRSNIFAYLFEITDVSKLSNANSEEPSPIEDLEKKNSPTSNIDRTIAQLLSEDSTTIECDTMVSPTNQYNSNITPYDYEKSEKNLNQLMCELNDITIPPITSYNTVTSGTIHGSTTTAETIAEPNNYFNIENETLKAPNLNDKSKENSIDTKFVHDISVATKITYTNIAASSSDTATSFVTTDNDASNTIPNSYNLDVSCYSSETSTPYKNGINSIQDVTELATSVGTISLESNLFNSKETRIIDNTNKNFLNTTIEEISQMASETSIPYPTITDTISTFTLESNMSSIVADIPPLTPIPCLTQSSIQGASKTKNDNALDSLDTTCISKESCTINKLENQIATTETTLTNDKLIICNQYESSQSEYTCDQHSNKTIIESIDKPTKCETLIEIAHPAHNAMPTKENIVNLALVQDITNSLSPVITIEQNNMNLLNNLETNTNITPVLEELCVKDFKVSEHISSANNNGRLSFIALSSDSFINIIPDLESNYSPVDNTMVDNQPKDQSVSTYVPTSITDKETEEMKEKEENEVTKMELDNKKEDSANYKIETDISVKNDTTTENSEKLIKRVYEADRKCDISSLSENNLSIDYFTKSGLEIDFVTELPPLTNRFKIHPPSIKDTPKSKSLDNEILQDLCFTKLKKIKLNLVDSYSTEEVTDNKKEIDYTFKEHPFRNKSDNSENVGGRCYFSKILKSLSLESDVYEEVSRKSDRLSPALSQAALDIEEDSELIRRKLWAGVKSLSLDAEVLIATNKDQKSCVDISTSSMPALDESPTDGFKESGHGCTTHNEIGDPQSSLIKRFQKRRKSEAALKLMKENTKIIDQILNQRYDEWLENNFGAKNNYESHDENETKFLTRKSSSEHSISDYLSCDTNFTKLDATSKKQGINENQCQMINKIENTSVITSDKRSLSQEEILSNYTGNDLYSSKDVITFVQSQCHEKNSFEKISDDKFSHSMNMPASTYSEKEIIARKDELQDMDHTRTSPLPLDFNISPSEDNSLSPSKSCDNNEKHSSESSPVITSKYFSSILKPETGKLKIKLEGSESDSSCPKTKPASFNNVALEKKSASKPPSVTFSKLSKLSPKSSGKSSNDQLKSKKTISFHSIESNSKNDSGSTKLQTTKQSSLGKPQIKCPFPTKPIDRPPKDLGVKLGLYSATRFNNA